MSNSDRPLRPWRPFGAGAAIAALLLATAPSFAHAATQADAARAAIESQIVRLGKLSGGEVGVSARHLQTGLTVASSGGAQFPMASTFKIAVAGAVLARVDARKLSLDQLVAIDPAMTAPSAGIAEVFPFPGISLSVNNLIESMIVRSDNTATDVLVKLVGGPAAVTAWVKAQGVEGLRVDGDTSTLIGRFYGVPTGQPVFPYLEKAVAANPALETLSDGPNPSYDNDPRDTSTPNAMVALLSRIADGRALSASSTKVLLGAMERCVTGRNRLQGMLPAGTVVQHKTGTLGGTVNDVGLVTLPDGRGQFAIAVFVKKSALSEDARAKAIAEVTRTIYDYMLVEYDRMATETTGR